MKFCCDKFEGYHQESGFIGDGALKRETYPSIKIVNDLNIVNFKLLVAYD